MKNVFYFEQNFDDINILNCDNKIILSAKRDVNWFGKIKTIIQNDNIGRIEGTYFKIFFLETFKIVKSTKLKINFIENKKNLKIENSLIEIKNVGFLASHIFINDLFVCNVSLFNFWKFSNKNKYKIEFVNNFHNFEYIFIFLCLTEDISYVG
jgi:hypothetical protein